MHEVVIHNEDLGSVITWDFDVLRHGVSFCVYCTKNVIPASSTPATPTGANIIEHRSVIEKSWKEGKDFFIVEPNVVCFDGESIQVSIFQKLKNII